MGIKIKELKQLAVSQCAAESPLETIELTKAMDREKANFLPSSHFQQLCGHFGEPWSRLWLRPSTSWRRTRSWRARRRTASPRPCAWSCRTGRSDWRCNLSSKPGTRKWKFSFWYSVNVESQFDHVLFLDMHNIRQVGQMRPTKAQNYVILSCFFCRKH